MGSQMIRLRFVQLAMMVLACMVGLGIWLFIAKLGPFSSGVLPQPTIAFIESDLRDLGLTTIELRPGANANGVSWQVTFRGKVLLGMGNYHDTRLEPVRLVFKRRGNFSDKSCPSGGFYINGNILCSDGINDFHGETRRVYSMGLSPWVWIVGCPFTTI
jgi:hypothetical protein